MDDRRSGYHGHLPLKNETAFGLRIPEEGFSLQIFLNLI